MFAKHMRQAKSLAEEKKLEQAGQDRLENLACHSDIHAADLPHEGERNDTQRELKDLRSQLAAELRQRQKLEKELHLANKLKDEFLATITHELRTPLGVVIGWADLLCEGELGREEQQEAFATIRRNARIQLELIENILTASQLEAGSGDLKFRSINLGQVICEVIQEVQQEILQKNLQLAKDFNDSEIFVHADARKLHEALIQLVKNAIKFTPEYGYIAISMCQVNAHAEIRIKDSGEGIAASFLPLVFERFRQEDNSLTRRHGGLGLGLAIVRHVMEAHGGSVLAESEGKGKGASFTLKIPIESRRYK